VRKFLALSFIQRALMLAVYVGATMILARLLTPEQVGIFSMTAAFVGVAAAIREFGMTEFLIQERNLTRDTIRATYGIAILVGCVVGAIVLALAPTIAAVYQEPLILSIAYVLCLNFVLLPFATPSMALLIREMSLGKAWGLQSAALVTQYAVSVFLAWRGFGPISLAWGSVASSVCSVILLNMVRPAEVRLLPTLKGAGPAWRYGSKFAAASSLEIAAKNVHEFIIPQAFGFAALGLYSRAAGLFEQFNQTFTRAISRVLVPTFALQARGDSTELASNYGKATSLFTCVTWSIFGFIAITAPQIILVLFGNQWREAAPLLQAMCLAGLIQAAYAFAGDVLSSLGDIGAKLRIMSVATPVWVALCLAGSLVGVEAIAFLSAGPAVVSLVMYSRRLEKLVGFSTKHLLQATFKSAFVALATAAAALLTFQVDAIRSAPAIVQLAASGTFSGLMWLAACFALKHPLSLEIRQLPARLSSALRRGN
jgi:O-antigen/teichoic acid export membrane protein